MGKIASKVWSRGLLGGFGMPQMEQQLTALAGWSREGLIQAYQHFLDHCEFTLDRHQFTDVFQCFPDTTFADAAFRALQPKKGKLDGNTIFAAATVTSNQSFISRVSLLFSIFDMDGDGTLNKAEFTLGLRSLLHGLRLFFTEAVVPSDMELEVATEDIFRRIDADKSGFVTLGEFLVYAYRSRDLHELVQNIPVDVEDVRVEEDMVPFQRIPVHLSGPEAESPRKGSKEGAKHAAAVEDSAPAPAKPMVRRAAGGIRPRGSLDSGASEAEWLRRGSKDSMAAQKRHSECLSLKEDALSPVRRGSRPRGSLDSGASEAESLRRGSKDSMAMRSHHSEDTAPSTARGSVRRFTGGSHARGSLDAGTWCGSLAYVKMTGRKRAGPSRPSRVWTPPAEVSKAQAWLLWKFFHHLSQHSSRADVELVLNFLRDPIAVRKEFLAIAGSAKAEDEGVNFAQEVEGLGAQFQRALLETQVRQRLEQLQTPLTMRGFLCLSFFSLVPTHIESILVWCDGFYAAEVLQSLLNQEAIAITEEEVDIMLRALDVDGSGDLSLAELVAGQITAQQAEHLFEKCHRRLDAAISDKDIKSYIQSLKMALGKDVKGVLQTFAQAAEPAAPHCRLDTLQSLDGSAVEAH
ncbi:unnamed protein product [Effrenium voratum]|uniref:EF-hand domain-containing protein n=1 Tax=Effrenium voratum TaxID=2562239 RepID=A0AA36J8I0_9DINO|nr:unnamed protein product [Effrenium voratum]